MRGVGNNKGQVTVFIILALLIVVAGVLVYTLSPKLKSTSTSFEDNPKAYIQDCLEDEIETNIEIIANNGGVFENEHFVLNQGKELEYLCYTQKYLEFCTVERPLLVSLVKTELEKSIDSKIESCFSSLKENYEKKGYTVSLVDKGYKVNIIPETVRLDLNYSMTFTKSSTEKIDSFEVVVDNNIYELISIAYNILNWEATYGDANVDVYMDFNPSIIIEKLKKDDGTKIYIIQNLDSKQKFQFASRSLVWAPAGNNY